MGKQEDLSPHLHVISIGEDPASQVFIEQKRQKAHEASIAFSRTTLPETATLEELRSAIILCNADSAIHGIIVQLPLPHALETHQHEVLQLVDPSKDVDCFHPLNCGQLTLDQPVFLPATPGGILKLLQHYDIETKGKLCVILGKSNIVGKPLSLLLANERGPAATVVLCDRYTEQVSELTRQADVLIVAAGKHHLIDSPAWLREDRQAVVIDVGIHRVKNDAGKTVLQGDVKADAVREHCRFLTPVPGGVGPMTVACLLEQVVEAASQMARRELDLKRRADINSDLMSKEELKALMTELNPAFLSDELEAVLSDLSSGDGCVSLQRF